MQVIATAPGFYGSYRNVDDKFDVPDDAKATWFEPVDAPKDEPQPAAAADDLT